MLRLEHISVAYGKHEALHDITLDVEPGRTTVILGANGAGKTTLLKTIAGLVRPQPGGRILFEGRPIENLAPHEIVASGIALVPEGRRLFGEMTVIENLRLGAYPEHARADEKEQLEKQLKLFPRLAERRSQIARTMSGGEQQMLAVARALMSEPKILLLDEPSLGLSPLLVKDLFSIIRRITETGQSVVLVEQNAHQSLRLADRVYVLENGHIRASGTPQEIQQDAVIQQAYLGSDQRKVAAPPVAAPPLAPAAAAPTAAAFRGLETAASGGFRNPAARSVEPAEPAEPAEPTAASATPAPAAPDRGPDRPAAPHIGKIERDGGFVNPFARTVAPKQSQIGSKDQQTMAREDKIERTGHTAGAQPASAPAAQAASTVPPREAISRTGGFVNPFARSVSENERKSYPAA